ncbi:MAG: hypothetical protein ACREA0_21320, partial [bacterium]
PQVGPAGLESSRQPSVLIHRSHSLVALRHSSDARAPRHVTRETNVTGFEVKAIVSGASGPATRSSSSPGSIALVATF